MSNARQRALLSALGIQQWIPRAVKTVAANTSDWRATEQLWRQGNESFYTAFGDRDLNAPPNSSLQISGAQAANSKENTSGNPAHQIAASGQALDHQAITDPQTTPQPAISALNPASIQADPSEYVSTKIADHTLPVPSKLPDQVPKPAQFSADLELGSAVETAAPPIGFRLQACEINQWVILINEQDLQSPDMHALWQNILKAFHQPTVIHFSWPLSEGQRWQRSTGAKSALNGFLFRMGLDKRVGLMSNLPDEICPDRVERLPHLTELLAEPLKKRTLWQLLNAA